MSTVFGDFLEKFNLSDEKAEQRAYTNQIATENHDGAIEVDDAINGFQLKLDWSSNTQADMIQSYRETANYNIVDYAIEDIVNEMVSFNEDEDPIEVDLSDIEDSELSPKIKDKIYESYYKISSILDLKESVHRRAKQFYIDGRLAYQKVIDQNKPHDGLLGVIELDTRFVTKYRQTEYDNQSRTIKSMEETFIYDENINQKDVAKNNTKRAGDNFREALRLDPKTITYVTSGLVDYKTGFSIGWLNKAVKPANQLRMMENALVIYRITRAPERRIFYVDTSNLPKTKAEAYLRNLKNNYRNRMSYNPESGDFKDNRHLTTMQEDYWLPRNTQGKGTEVSTLPGGTNLSDIDDVKYFQQELYKALNIPITRLEQESVMQFGRTSEINRDELKFSKFVSKIRKRFNSMLLDLIKTDVILRKVVTIDEWDKFANKIKFKYAQDLYLEEQKKAEMLRDRIELLNEAMPYIGKYISHKYARSEILQQTETEIEEEDKEIAEEKDNEQYNPAEPIPEF